MIFPNGKKYLGKTNNLRRRLKEHLKAFQKSNDWHRMAAEQFLSEKSLEDLGLVYRDFFFNVELYFKDTNTGQAAYQMEQEYLTRIMKNNRQEEYYNISYPTLKKEVIFTDEELR